MVGFVGDDVGGFYVVIDCGGDGFQWYVVECDEEFFVEEEIEFGGVEFFVVGEVDGVCDEEQVVFVVFDFWE